MHPTMEGVDAVSGALAECTVVIDGTRYNFMQLYKFESKIEKKLAEIPILGKTGKGHKPAGWVGSWNGTAHYNQSVIREMLLRYKKTGEDLPFDIHVTNSDASSVAGRQTVIHKHCFINGGTLAKFDATSEYLDEDISGTFDDWMMPESFRMLPGMV